MVFPELEELVIGLKNNGAFDIENVTGMAARAPRGAKLGTDRIVGKHGSVNPQLDVSELKKHVSRVESQCS